MAKLSKNQIERFIVNLDWTGHIELPQNDINWLAEQLAALLSGEGGRCEACGDMREIVVETPLGQMCEDCIKSALREAREAREGLEEE
jgi:hypothetical protein